MSGSIQTIKGASRYFKVVPATLNQPGAPFLEIGPAGTTTSVSTLVIAFKPDVMFDGQFYVVGRPLGPAADDANIPFVPIPYRRVSLGDVASDYAMVADPISTAALINVPANGLTVALLFSLSVGQCEIASWDLQGSSSV